MPGQRELFYEHRARITKRLIEEKGFTGVGSLEARHAEAGHSALENMIPRWSNRNRDKQTPRERGA
jgi:hypothetical protein